MFRWLRRRRSDADKATVARRDLAVGLALGVSWLAIWGLYFAYARTVGPGSAATTFVLPLVRFYVPALGLIALLGAWLVTRLPSRGALAGVAAVAVTAALFGLGVHSFDVMTRTAHTKFQGKRVSCPVSGHVRLGNGRVLICFVHGRPGVGSVRFGPRPAKVKQTG